MWALSAETYLLKSSLMDSSVCSEKLSRVSASLHLLAMLSQPPLARALLPLARTDDIAADSMLQVMLLGTAVSARGFAARESIPS
jgi:hypothetical protein